MLHTILFVFAALLFSLSGYITYSFFKIRREFRTEISSQLARRCPKRWIVGGMMGSGKTTFARSISSTLHIKHIEIDGYSSEEEVLDAVAAADAVGWIAEANPWQIPHSLGDKADIIVFLDYNNVVNYLRLLARGFEEWRQESFSFHGFKRSIVDRAILDLGKIVYLHGRNNRAGWRHDGLIKGMAGASAIFIHCSSPAELKLVEEIVMMAHCRSAISPMQGRHNN